MLADAYMRRKWFAHCDPADLAADVRWQRLARAVEALNADVVCCQEVEAGTFAALGAALPGFGAFHHLKAGGKPDGCGLFVRESAVAVEAVQRLVHTDGTGHIAQIARLRCKRGAFTVVNTHVRWDPPGTPEAEQKGLGQIRAIVDATRDAGEALIVCGDFNAGAESALARTLRERGLHDAYEMLPGAFTCNANRRLQRIDFIFHGGRWTSTPAALPVIEANTPLPGPDLPSDHLAILARLEWVTPQSPGSSRTSG